MEENVLLWCSNAQEGRPRAGVEALPGDSEVVAPGGASAEPHPGESPHESRLAWGLRDQGETEPRMRSAASAALVGMTRATPA